MVMQGIQGNARRRSFTVIERIFSSPALYRTLALFFRYPEEPLNPRLISRHTGTGMKSVLREIRKLEEMGIIRGRTAGQYRLYRLDRDHPAHDGLRSIFAGTKREWEQVTRSPSVRMWEKRGWEK
jgi:DNA-binding transcriptional ArsR family regulator